MQHWTREMEGMQKLDARIQGCKGLAIPTFLWQMGGMDSTISRSPQVPWPPTQSINETISQKQWKGRNQYVRVNLSPLYICCSHVWAHGRQHYFSNLLSKISSPLFWPNIGPTKFPKRCSFIFSCALLCHPSQVMEFCSCTLFLLFLITSKVACFCWLYFFILGRNPKHIRVG